MPRHEDDDDRPRKRRPRDDEDDENRPRSRRRPRDDDFDDDRPRRQSRRDDDDRPARRPAKELNVLGLISMIGGIGALLVGIMPCVGSFAVIPGLIALVLGIIGLVIARRSEGRQGKGMAIAGISTASGALVLSLVWFLVIGRVTSKVGDMAEEARREREQEAELVRTAAAIPVTAESLGQALRTNRVKAEADYKDQVLEVTGVIYKLMWEDTTTVILDSGGEEVVSCDFSNDQKADLKQRLSKGLRVTIRGRVKYMYAHSYQLKSCILVR